MDNRPIGVFDSGLGGLTAVKVLEEMLPGEDIIYFGDAGRMPYGGRSVSELRHFAYGDASFLRSFGVKAVLIACGTISSNAMDYLAENFDTPFFGVLQSTVSAAAAAAEKHLGVIATEASIKSGMYQKLIRAERPELRVTAVACPGLAPIVESGHFSRGDAIAEETVGRELAEIKSAGVDTLILGCTHFPLLEDVISDFLGGGVGLISSGAEAAKALAAYLEENRMLSGRESGGKRRYFTSGDCGFFSAAAENFLGHPVLAESRRVD